MLRSLTRHLIRIAACVLLVLGTRGASAGERVALVIGNGDYQHVQRLANPRNDAGDVAKALKGLGFDVDLQLDLDRAGMWRAVKTLARRAKDADAAVFFYAGHGVQKDRLAYLIPTDAMLDSEVDLSAFAVRLNELLAPLDGSRRPTLVFLDACRNDPFAAEGDASRGLVASSGLGAPSAGAGMLIAYATGEGDTADDGRQRNSPFTKALLSHLGTPGLEVKSMLTRVRQELTTSGGRQLSETSDRLLGDFYFKSPEPQPAVAAPTGQGSLADRSDFVFWNAVQGSTDPSDIQLFLDQFPTSPLVPLAQRRLVNLRSAMALGGLRTGDEPRAAAPATTIARLDPPRPATIPEPGAAAAPAPRPAPPPVVAALPPELPPPAPPVPAPPAPANAEIRQVVSGGVNLRAARNGKAARIAFLRGGTELKVANRRSGWVEVWAPGEQHGFVAESYLAPTAEQLAAIEAARVPKVPARSPGEIFRDCPECPELAALRAGTFTIGSGLNEIGRDLDEGPRGQIVLGKPIAVGRFEVTFAEWDACVAGGGCNLYQPPDRGWGRARRPVIHVSYGDVQAYLAWLSQKSGKRYRLLSEAEWEYAARAGSTGANPWDEDDSAACRFANIHDETSAKANAYGWTWARCTDGQPRTAPVGTYEANAFGLMDMLGNVAEHTADCWNDDLVSIPADGSPAQAGDCTQRALRGGDWRANLDAMRFAQRAAAPANSRTAYDGFRVARDLDEGFRDGLAGPVAGGS